VHGIDANVDTPTLDNLATNGALITSGYTTAPQCVPSRAGLITGRIQNEFGLRENGDAPLPLTETTIADRMKVLGYKTGHVGKWHLGTGAAYQSGARGFDEYWNGANNNYLANFDLSGNTIPEQTINDTRNRVIVQGEAAEAFIDRNYTNTFFLYLALYGPHLPRISTNDSYYLNFPAVDYPNYDDELDDIRRQGLALIKAIDDAVDGVMKKPREHSIEEDTLILKYSAPRREGLAVGGWDEGAHVCLLEGYDSGRAGDRRTGIRARLHRHHAHRRWRHPCRRNGRRGSAAAPDQRGIVHQPPRSVVLGLGG